LTDFGIARASGMGRITGTGMAIGTLAYMSPEQVRAAQVDARSDIYSLGLTFYEAVTGRRAIDGETEMELLNAQLSAIPPEPAAVNPFVPAAVSTAIMRSLAKEPERRYQTALEFQNALRDLGQPHAAAVSQAVGSTVSMADLAELETRLSRAIGPISKRLVADAARRYASIGEIRRVLAAEIQDPRQREKFLDTSAHTTMTLQVGTAAAPARFDAATIDRLTSALAPYMGPIARVLVGRAAKTARDLPELENSLGAEIAREDDRRRFLAALRSAL
jgi:serine/threonine-protein kinase